MATAEGTLIEVRAGPGGAGGLLSCPPAVQPQPGQYMLAWSPADTGLLAASVFPASLPGAAIALSPPLPPSWTPGARLQLRGPFGRGFDLPRGTEKIALAAFHAPPGILLPLVSLAVDRGAAVAFYAADPPAGLPLDVESLPLDMLPEALRWADVLAAALPAASLSLFRRACGLTVHQRFPSPAQALLFAPMPCAGTAGCGICSISTSRGEKLACKDGPVFDLNLLELT